MNEAIRALRLRGLRSLVIGAAPALCLRRAHCLPGARPVPFRPLQPLVSSEPCGCWFEKNVMGGLLGCQECPDGKTCTVGTCRKNFCEVQ